MEKNGPSARAVTESSARTKSKRAIARAAKDELKQINNDFFSKHDAVEDFQPLDDEGQKRMNKACENFLELEETKMFAEAMEKERERAERNDLERKDEEKKIRVAVNVVPDEAKRTNYVSASGKSERAAAQKRQVTPKENSLGSAFDLISLEIIDIAEDLLERAGCDIVKKEGSFADLVAGKAPKSPISSTEDDEKEAAKTLSSNKIEMNTKTVINASASAERVEQNEGTNTTNSSVLPSVRTPKKSVSISKRDSTVDPFAVDEENFAAIGSLAAKEEKEEEEDKKSQQPPTIKRRSPVRKHREVVKKKSDSIKRREKKTSAAAEGRDFLLEVAENSLENMHVSNGGQNNLAQFCYGSPTFPSTFNDLFGAELLYQDDNLSLETAVPQKGGFWKRKESSGEQLENDDNSKRSSFEMERITRDVDKNTSVHGEHYHGDNNNIDINNEQQQRCDCKECAEALKEHCKKVGVYIVAKEGQRSPSSSSKQREQKQRQQQLHHRRKQTSADANYNVNYISTPLLAQDKDEDDEQNMVFRRFDEEARWRDRKSNF